MAWQRVVEEKARCESVGFDVGFFWVVGGSCVEILKIYLKSLKPRDGGSPLKLVA